MLDDVTQDLLAHYPTCERFIDQGLREKGAVLIVHWYSITNVTYTIPKLMP
jgi:hypothetical protein